MSKYEEELQDFNTKYRVATPEEIELLFYHVKRGILISIVVAIMIIGMSYGIAVLRYGDPSPGQLIGNPTVEKYPSQSEEAQLIYSDRQTERNAMAEPTTVSHAFGDGGYVSDTSPYTISPSEGNLDDKEIGDPADYEETDYTV